MDESGGVSGDCLRIKMCVHLGVFHSVVCVELLQPTVCLCPVSPD